jgi:hypothetical protein
MNLPPVPETFQWRHEAFGPVLRCTPLAAAAPHLFTTRQLPLSRASDWTLVARTLGVRRVETLAQVHGRSVRVVRRGRA